VRLHSGLCAISTIVIGFASLGAVQAQDAVRTKPGDPAAGDDVFIKCSGCHQVGPGAANSIGPTLNGMVGRAAGTVAGYDYSAALKDSKLSWNHDTLAAFLVNAKQVVPGTKMSYAGLKNPQDVEDLIAYLAQFDADGKTK
jgi:cytochrome c